jgi:hypothetical protein
MILDKSFKFMKEKRIKLMITSYGFLANILFYEYMMGNTNRFQEYKLQALEAITSDDKTTI